mmetsp:Transcript_4625/g.11185  ORF Transcript_4625/g.11185 Transcript_4625/m.11185 type:complete len:271 (+) Transcript_4625:1593-2405(+)
MDSVAGLALTVVSVLHYLEEGAAAFPWKATTQHARAPGISRAEFPAQPVEAIDHWAAREEAADLPADCHQVLADKSLRPKLVAAMWKESGKHPMNWTRTDHRSATALGAACFCLGGSAAAKIHQNCGHSCQSLQPTWLVALPLRGKARSEVQQQQPCLKLLISSWLQMRCLLQGSEVNVFRPLKLLPKVLLHGVAAVCPTAVGSPVNLVAAGVAGQETCPLLECRLPLPHRPRSRSHDLVEPCLLLFHACPSSEPMQSEFGHCSAQMPSY